MKTLLTILFSTLLLSNLSAEEAKPPVVATPVPPVAAAANPATGDWSQIFRDLQAPDAVVKEAAAKSLAAALEDQAKAYKKPYFDHFKKALNSADATVRENAVKTAALIGIIFQNDKRHFPEMIKNLSTGTPAEKTASQELIFKSLSAMLQSDYARDFIDQLGDENPQVVAKAVEQIKAMKSDAADELANALDEEKVQVKKQCAELLRELGPDAKDAVGTLVFKLRDEDDKLGRKFAVQVLENLGPNAEEAIEDLVQNLDDEDKVLRRLSVNIMKKIGPAYKSVVSDIIVYLTHDEKAVRNLATELLIPLGAEAVNGVKDLIEIIDEPVPVAPVPPVAAVAPVPVPATTPVDPAAPKQPIADGNDSDSKLRAANVLASIGPAAKDALPALEKLAKSTEPALQEAAKAAIEKIKQVKK